MGSAEGTFSPEAAQTPAVMESSRMQQSAKHPALRWETEAVTVTSRIQYRVRVQKNIAHDASSAAFFMREGR